MVCNHQHQHISLSLIDDKFYLKSTKYRQNKADPLTNDTRGELWYKRDIPKKQNYIAKAIESKDLIFNK